MRHRLGGRQFQRLASPARKARIKRHEANLFGRRLIRESKIPPRCIYELRVCNSRVAIESPMLPLLERLPVQEAQRLSAGGIVKIPLEMLIRVELGAAGYLRVGRDENISLDMEFFAALCVAHDYQVVVAEREDVVAHDV